MSHKIRRTILFYQDPMIELEVIISIAIISILIGLAATSFKPYIQKAKITQVAGGASYIEMKLDMMLYHALHGQWPESNEAALRCGWADEYGRNRSSMVKRARIDNGAIHFVLGDNFEGKVLTIRPGHPIGNPFGPVIWVMGESVLHKNWSFKGEDKTNVDNIHIPSALR